MTGTDLCVRLYKSVPVIFEPPCIILPTEWKMGHTIVIQTLNKLFLVFTVKIVMSYIHLLYSKKLPWVKCPHQL